MLRPVHHFLQTAIVGMVGAMLICATSPSAERPAATHPIHTTVTEIVYNAKSQALHITLKAFTDDFEAAIRKNGAPVLYLGDEKEVADANDHIRRYLGTHLAIALNGKPQPLIFIGKEAKPDVTWCYIEIPYKKTIHTVGITNRLHTDLYTDQQNLLHCTLYGKRQSEIFSASTISASMTWAK